MKFSVIIPAYNAEKFIGKCLDSVINQKYEDYEIVIIDDCSTDRTWEIINEYQWCDKIVPLRNDRNIGVAGTRNRGIIIAKGEWLTFLDADDWVNSEILHSISEKIEKNNDVEIIQTNLMVWDGGKTSKWSEVKDNIIYEKKELIDNIISLNYGMKKYGIYGNSRCAGGKFYKKDAVMNLRFPEGLFLFEDGLFNLKAYDKAKAIMLSNDAYYNYRRTENSATRKYDERKSKQFSLILGSIGKFVKMKNDHFESYNHCKFELMIDEVNNYVGTNIKQKLKKIKKIITIRNKQIDYSCFEKTYLSKREKVYYYTIVIKMYILLYWELLLIKKI